MDQLFHCTAQNEVFLSSFLLSSLSSHYCKYTHSQGLVELGGISPRVSCPPTATTASAMLLKVRERIAATEEHV
jgi:hypothetical protein